MSRDCGGLLSVTRKGTIWQRFLIIAPTSITTDGFTIRGYLPGDGPALQVATVSSYEHLHRWMSWATTEQTDEEAEAICRRFAAQYLLNQNVVLGVWIDGELAGGTGFHLRWGPLEFRTADIGMWIRASYAGQGLGTRVLHAMLGWGFEEWGWERLTWSCDTRNVASARVAERTESCARLCFARMLSTSQVRVATPISSPCCVASGLHAAHSEGSRSGVLSSDYSV